ncbi:MAG: hypothetical protein NWS71_07605 [Opitutales bacterium]|jgi:hypothetical protein|nr:hypothetical protein [Opitutales bacterium]MDP4776992.1 hypothetical protein [Opitutales bacterium]MDP4883057.1 hypothetical protein [Opitutales bacterium]MDP5079638.1 hypothetical protein [Opitutales bacterium]
MPFKVRLSHINPDFTVEPVPEGSWTDEMADDDALIYLMNRVAVSEHGQTLVEFPEIEITKGSQRVTVTSVKGQLFYNDPHSANRQNLKVVPEEVIRLLQDKPLDEVFTNDSEQHEAPTIKYQKKSTVAQVFGVLALLGMAVVMFICGRVILHEFTYRPSLIVEPKFIHTMEGEQVALKKYSGVFVSEYREGGLVFQLLDNGHSDFYEMWWSPERNRFILILTESHDTLVGINEGKLAFLAGDYHLILPTDSQTMTLHGITYQRHEGSLDDVGEVVTVETL